MDWADDTAYAINDLVDSISGGFINIVKLMNWQEKNSNQHQNEIISEMIGWIKAGNYKEEIRRSDRRVCAVV